MLNYIKSECYRILHSKEIYLITLILSALTVLMNLLLYLFSTSADFPYSNVRYSLNMLTGNLNMMMCAAWLVACFTFGDEHKNGTLKNVVAYGISRNTFFMGKIIVGAIMSLVSMAVVLLFYIGSAYLLLQGREMEPLWQLLKGVGASLPSALASLVLAVLLNCLLKKESLAALLWVVIIVGLPAVSFYLGLKVDLINKAAEWMPYNFFRFEAAVNLTDYACLWNTPDGLAKCLLAGLAGIVIFYVSGILLFRKKDIA